MKSLRDTPVKQLATALLAAIFIILVAEYMVMRSKITSLQHVEQQTDFARLAQIKSQQIALQLQYFTKGNTILRAEITARLEEQDHLLQTLADGGRIDGTDLFLKPLSRLEKITFDNLLIHWNKYKQSVQRTLSENIAEPVSVPVASITNDSLQSEVVMPTTAISPPFAIDGQWLTVSSWYDRLITDINEEQGHTQSGMDIWFIFFAVLDLCFLVSIYWFFDQYIIKPIKQLELNTQHQHATIGYPHNEIGSVALKINETLEHLKDATEFVQKIGEGNLTMQYQELDSHYQQGKNKLADSLIAMQGKLKAVNDEEQKRQWANEGLARFVDILRTSNDDIHKLGDQIISALVKYTGSNQGSLYILNDDDATNSHLELISLFAFETKKFENKKIKLGEGLLGQTFLEKETTYLNELPEEYIRITSGLGDANPKSVLMVPLKVDMQIYGIVELASFKAYQPHEIAFVEKLGETIASTLASVKSAQRNRHLIEQFQEQTEVMRAQEEEMRQNMEELQATQEEIARKERDYITRIKELESKPEDDSQLALAEVQNKLTMQGNEYQIRIKDLEHKLREKPAKGNDWQLAEDVEKTLKINLEALKITQQELEKKSGKN